MNRKAILVSAAFILLCILFWVLPIRFPFSPIHPHQAIPNNTALFFTLSKKHLDSLLVTPPTGQFAQLVIPNTLAYDYKIFQNLLGDQLQLKPDELFHVTVNSSKTLGTDHLFMLSGQRSLDLAKSLSNNKDWRSRTFTFKNQEVITLKTENDVFSFAKFRNLLLAARHAYLVEDALSQLKNQGSCICQDKAFRKTQRTGNKQKEHVSVVLNTNNLPGQFAPLIDPSQSEKLKSLNLATKWSRWEIPYSANTSVWNGAISPVKTNAILTASLNSKPSDEELFLQTLPDNLSGFIFLQIDEFDKQLMQQPWYESVKNWIGGEVIFAMGESTESSLKEQFLMVKSSSEKQAESYLISNSLDKKVAFEFQMFQIYQVSSLAIYDFEIDKVFATSLGSYLLFANSKAGIERWLGKYLAGQTCANYVPLLSMKAGLETKYNGLIYSDGVKGWQHLSPLLSAEYLTSLNQNPLPFEKLAATIVWERRIGQLKINTLQNPIQEKLPANILWSVPLSGEATSKPYVFTNPKNDELDILIADQSGHLNLISRSGRVIWKKKLQEPIKSDIFHIDFFNNNEGQFAFSTQSAIYVIDRNGEYLDGFPLQLQVPATNGVTVVDFFQSHDYHFFIACENGKAYGFDEKGSPIEGWRPNEDIGRVEHPLLHFQAEGKDFLVLLDILGNLQVFKKNGSPRFKKLRLEEPLLQKPNFQVSRKSSRIVTSNNEGTVFVTNLAGDHFRLQLKAGENKNVKFLFADVVGDDRKDYIALSSNELEAYCYEGNKFGNVLTHSYPSPQDEIFPVNIGEKRKAYIGTVNQRKKQISLIDGQGKMPDQFPLEGTTPFVITNLSGDGKFVVITGNGDRVTAYSLK